MTYNTKQTVINVKYNAIDFIAKKQDHKLLVEISSINEKWKHDIFSLLS